MSVFNPVKDKTAIIQNNTDYTDYLLPIIDADNAFIGGWLKDGSFKISKWFSETVTGSAIKNQSITISKLAAEVINSFASAASTQVLSEYIPINSAETGWLRTWTDSSEKLLFGIKSDGTFKASKLRIEETEISTHVLVNSESGWLRVWTDSNERILFGVKNDGTFYAKKYDFPIPENSISFSKLDTETQEKINSGIESLIVEAFGDSLTAGAGGTPYTSVLQTLLGSKYQVVNCGVGGENVPTIAARQGGVPAVITEAFTLPASTTPVVVSTYSNRRIKNLLNNYNIDLLFQGEGNSVNPCYIQDIECTLTYAGTGYSDTSGTWSLQRNVAASAPKNIVANSKLLLSGAKKYRKSFASIFFIGQNGGYANDNELVDYYKRMIEFSGCVNYVIIGLHSGTAISRAALELTMENAFGHRYINWRQYIVSYGLADAGIAPTTADNDAMAEGSAPPSLLSDSVHLNTAGYALLGTKIYKTFLQLNYITN